MMNGLVCHSGMFLGSILALAFLVASVGGLGLFGVTLFRRTTGRAAAATGTAGQGTAKEALQAQYARGEVTREQYEAGKQKLEADSEEENRKGVSQ